MANRDSKPLPHLSASDIRRFLAQIDKRGPDDCWFWTGSLINSGYGYFGAGGQRLLAHRVALFLHSGVDPFPLCACHSCDIRYPPSDFTSRRCCNGSHLFQGTRDENFADMFRKGRVASGDRNGSRTRPDRIARGERHGRPSAKLIPEQISYIRMLYAQGNISQRALGIQFGVDHGTICRLISGECWAHIPT